MHIMQHPYFIRIYNWKCSLHLSLSLLLPPSFSLSLSLSVYLCLSSCERHIAFIICMAYRTCKCWQNFGRVPALFLPIHPKIPDGTGHEPPPSPTSLPPPPPPVVCNHQASQHPSSSPPALSIYTSSCIPICPTIGYLSADWVLQTMMSFKISSPD